MNILPENLSSLIGRRLQKIYGKKISEGFINRIIRLLLNNLQKNSPLPELWNEKDIVLITYGNNITEKNQIPLKTLNKFLSSYLKDEISCVHILPFFPFSSDDGFSVIDYYKVNPELGDWSDIAEIRKNFDLMFDLVINHVSQHHTWFKNFLQNENPGREYFIVPLINDNLSQVIRPRSLPLLTVFETVSGEKQVWTTFSPDQVDVNFQNPEVLYEMLKVFLFYLKKGVRIIRLDAVAFLWKTPGTNCLHLPQTHEIVKLLRAIGNIINPGVIILTETNVPAAENISYLGNGDEAHMIYQFSLPPLLLQALNSGNSKYLTEWAESIPELKAGNTFFNFTSSHDGIGVRPLKGLIPEKEIKVLIDNMQKQGGIVSYKINTDQSKSPYEINITYFSALKETQAGTDNYQKERFICSQTIMLAMKGIPAFYVHNLLSASNDYEGVKQTGMARSINRKVLDFNEVSDQLNNNTQKSEIFDELKRLIGIRKSCKAFHPDADMKIVNMGEPFFTIIRASGKEIIVSVSNITNKKQKVYNLNVVLLISKGAFTDLITQNQFKTDNFILNPYQTVWLCRL